MNKEVRNKNGAIYAGLNWLNQSQAANWLAQLAGIDRVKFDDMISLVADGLLPAYMDFEGMNLELMGDAVDAPISFAIGQGMGEVKKLMIRDDRGISWVHAIGPVRSRQTGEKIEAASFRMAASEANAPHLKFRREDVERLASKINPQKEKPIRKDERKGIEQIIAVLADLAGVDISKPYPAAEVLSAHAATKGLVLPSSPETIVRHFKAATERVSSDKKSY